MKVQEVISSCIMFIVSGLVLVGFTIAWFTNNYMPAVTGMQMQAVEVGHVKVALESGGADISELPDGTQYAEINVLECAGAQNNELGPGSSGTVTFYVTPVNNSDVEACDIVPVLWISQDGSAWHPGVRVSDEIADVEKASIDAEIWPEKLYEIAGRHIEFFSDEDMTVKITDNDPYTLTWTDGNKGTEQPATIYWKWHYEYPFTQTEKETLTATQQKEKIDLYDQEDMQLGNNLSHMKFYFTFAAR